MSYYCLTDFNEIKAAFSSLSYISDVTRIETSGPVVVGPSNTHQCNYEFYDDTKQLSAIAREAEERRTCPEGEYLFVILCRKMVNYQTTYTCPSDYQLSGNKCVKTTSKDPIKK